MKSNKRYTTQTFTKRVDHDGGLHRSALKLAEPTFCEKCGSIYTDGRWAAKTDVPVGDDVKHRHWRPGKPTRCPACKQMESGVVGGYLSLDGDFFKHHRIDIENLIKNEAQRSAEDNPLSRIMNWHEPEGKLMIETTTEHLAQRLGHALKKAFDGDVQYDFSHENKVMRVSWHRD